MLVCDAVRGKQVLLLFPFPLVISIWPPHVIPDVAHTRECVFIAQVCRAAIPASIQAALRLPAYVPHFVILFLEPMWGVEDTTGMHSWPVLSLVMLN